MAALRFKPGPFRSETRLCPLVSLLKSPPAILQAVSSPTCPSGGGTLPGAGCPWSPIRVAHLSPLLLPSSSTSHVLSCHCGPQDVLWLPASSPIKSKCLSLFSEVLSMPDLICHCSQTRVLLQPSSSVYCRLVPAVARAISPAPGAFPHIFAVLFTFAKPQIKTVPSL